MEKKGEGFALRRGLRWHREHEAIRPQTAGIGAGKAQGDVATRAPMYVIVPAHDWTHLAKESARPPLKSVDLRIALLSTNPLPSHLHPTINHQHLLNNPTTMNMFHVDNASASLSCGEDQTAAWSETTSAGYEATIAFDWGTSGPITVSTDLLWDMRLLTFCSRKTIGYSQAPSTSCRMSVSGWAIPRLPAPGRSTPASMTHPPSLITTIP